MIPDFKTYIRESVWADLHSRGIGETEREEDDVNLMDSKAFYDYLQKNYKDKVYNIGQENFSSVVHHIYVDVTKEIFVHIVYKTPEGRLQNIACILIGEPQTIKSEKIVSSLYRQFDVAPPRDLFLQREIAKKDDSELTNQTFLDIVDILLKKIKSNQKKPITESVWADLHSRGIGETEREEDKFFDLESLKEYIDNKIKTTTGDTLDLRNLDLSNLDSLKYENIIFDLTGYKRIKIIDVTGWKTSTIKNMSGVFDFCRNVEKIKGLETWDVSNAKDMSYMFSCCSSLTDINIERWKVDKVMNMEYMFYKCKSLKKLNLEHWNIDATTDYMFYECGTNFRPSWYK